MNKKELVKAVAQKLDWYETNADQAVNAVFNIIGAELVKGNRVQIKGFGTFNSYKRARHKINSIKDGQKISVPAKKVVTFRSGSRLKNVGKKK